MVQNYIIWIIIALVILFTIGINGVIGIFKDVGDAIYEVEEGVKDAINDLVEEECKTLSNESCNALREVGKTATSVQQITSKSKFLRKVSNSLEKQIK